MTANRSKLFCVFLCAVSLAAPMFAQGEAQGEDEALREEMKYIRALQEDLRMPDIAAEVIAEVKQKFPAAAAKLKVAEMQGLLSQGKFDEVQKIIDQVPDKKSVEYWALVIAKADAYYAFGATQNGDSLYDLFFKSNPKPEGAILSYYREAAYKRAQMMIYLGRDKDAMKAYELLLKVPLDEETQRLVWADVAELSIKLAPSEKDPKQKALLLAKAEELADKLLWKQDVWFGKAIVLKAHCLMLKKQTVAAQELIENYMPQLKIIHDSLREMDPDGKDGRLRMSPMPQCRYLLACLLQEEAIEEYKKDKPDLERIKDLILGVRDPQTKKRKANGAYNHFLNVFVRYPESQWAADAGNRRAAIVEFVKDLFNVDLDRASKISPDQMSKVRKMQFGNARMTFNQRKYTDAAKELLDVLEQFPETPESVSALGDLAVCYVNTWDGKSAYDDLMADTVAGYIADRFSANADFSREAGDQVRRIGDQYGEMNANAKKNEIYDLYFREFPDHYAAGQLLMAFAEREYAAKNFSEAMARYRTIAESYTNSTYYLDALSRIAQIQLDDGDTETGLASLQFYADKVGAKEDPGNAYIVALAKLAETQREYAGNLLKQAETNENETAKAELQAKGTQWMVKAVGGFGKIINLLSTNPGKYQKTAEETKRNQELKEIATFTKAIALTRLKSPKPEVQKKLRLGAIKAFEDYVAAYPAGKYAPSAQLQIGTLYTINEDMDNAQKALDKLSKDYPNSEEARNSVPMLAKALMDMGLRGEGVAKYRQMFAAGGKYTDGQYLNAADALCNSREYEMGIQAYEKVLASTKETSYRARALLGKAKCQAGLKRYSDAHKTIDNFLKDKVLSKTQMMLDINLLLVDVASEEGKIEKNDQMRVSLFNNAIDALKLVRAYKVPRNAKGGFVNDTPEQRAEDAELRLKSVEINLRRLDAEKKLNLEKQVADTRGKTIVQLEGIITSLNPNDSALLPVLEKAYYDCIPLRLEMGRNQDAEEDCEAYLKLFPNGKHASDVKTWLEQAKIK